LLLQQDKHGNQNTSPTQLPRLAKTTQPLECYWSLEPTTTETYSGTQRNKQLEQRLTTPVRPVTCTGQTGPGQIFWTEPPEHPTPTRDTPGHPRPRVGSPEQDLVISIEIPYTGQVGAAHRSDWSEVGNPNSKKLTPQAPN
jgi:hypothetical protein